MIMSRIDGGSPFPCGWAVAIACGLLLGADAARANVQIENVTVAPRDARTATVRFDIAWANSWRHEANHDAAWVFFKVRPEGETQWQHVRLSADKVLNPTGYGHGEGTPVDLIVPDGKEGLVGMFVRRSGYSALGMMSTHAVTAIWDLEGNKHIKDVTKVQMRAFGIQMVYVAEGPFYLGSGGTEVNGFHLYTDGKQHTRPYRVTSARAIPTGRQAGKLWARSSEPLYPKGAQPEDGGEIPASFPNGYAAFYCMKYPITWSQYAGFLNTLTAAEANEQYHQLRANPELHLFDGVEMEFPARVWWLRVVVGRRRGVCGLGGIASNDGVGVGEGRPWTARAGTG
jgi:hypothetical protein